MPDNEPSDNQNTFLDIDKFPEYQSKVYSLYEAYEWNASQLDFLLCLESSGKLTEKGKIDMENCKNIRRI